MLPLAFIDPHSKRTGALASVGSVNIPDSSEYASVHFLARTVAWNLDRDAHPSIECPRQRRSVNDIQLVEYSTISVMARKESVLA